MINAIAFDLWETLITDTPELSRRQERIRLDRMEAILADRGFGATAERIERAYRSLWRRCQELYWSFDRDIPCRRQIEHFIEALELDAGSFDEVTLDALERAYAEAAIEVPPSAVDGARETLAEVRARGLRVGLISNTGRTPGSALRRILERLDLAPSIDAMVFSNEHGECKPQASIFDALRRSLGGVPFEEMVFVGDNAYVDVYGAKRCGMRAIHFIPPVRGTAVAPPVEHDLEIVPDATVRSLREIPAVLDRFAAPVARRHG